jgi:type I restriction-modification system DNA methylase subunit/restriction endonuclease S subunit
MFEGFLDQGVKQSEGQFFTPMPIVKFILNSLPLESIIKDSELPPKAIDYACGAGHFLNELALQIKPFVKQHKETDIKEYYKEIVGIEKEYRLSKVAKVSAFMYGQDEIKITYADALGKNAKLEEGGYSILVANPPYSVKGFLQTLTEEERKAFELINTVDEKSLASNNSIETFFIERAKQLLKPGGVAGIILPSSILSNDSNIYSATREILIKYFDIVSIVEFGSQTFGKTGTNTVTLFLRRKEDNPAPAEHWQNRVEAWFSNNEAEAIYSDSNHIANYCNHVGIDPSHYRTLLTGNPNDILLATEVFIEYRKAFDKLAEIKNLVKQRTFKAKPKDEQEIELRRRFVEYLYVKEKDKLYYFVLASENKQKVLVVKYGSKTKEQKQFIGYSWSSAKGKEGIKYLSTAEIVEDDEEERENNDVGLSFDDKESLRILKNLNSILYIQTPLYNPINRHDTTKINYFIEQNFFGNELPIDDHLSSYMAYYQLTDMFDFSRKNFNKQISLTSKKTATIETKWEIAKLGDVVDVSIGGTPARENGAYFGGKNLWVSISEMKGQVIFDTKEKITNVGVNKSNVKLIPKGTTLLSFKLSIGKTAVAGEDLYTNEAIAGLIPRDKGKLLDSYLFNLFNAKQIDLESTGLKAFGKSLNSDFLKNDVKIPLPPKEIQAQIVAECKIVDIEVSNAEKEIEKMQRGIEKSIQNEYSKKYPMDKISNLSLVNPSKTEIRNINDDTLVSFVEMASVSESGFISNSVDKRLKDLRKGSYTYFKEGDVIIAKITPCMENGKCAVSNGLTNEIGMGSSEFHVIRTSEKIINKYLFALLNREEVRKEAEKKMTGASGHRRVPASFYENYRIPVPPLNDQMKLVAEIEKLEQIIKTEQIKIDTSADKKKEIMKKYL